jgi:hypothetical protein
MRRAFEKPRALDVFTTNRSGASVSGLQSFPGPILAAKTSMQRAFCEEIMNISVKKIFAATVVVVGSIFLGATVFPYQGGDNFDPWVRFTFQLAVGMPVVFSMFTAAKNRTVFFCCAAGGLASSLIFGFGFSAIISAASQSVLMDFEEDFLQIVAILMILFIAFKVPQECATKLNDDKIRNKFLWGKGAARNKPSIWPIVIYMAAVFGSSCIVLAVNIFSISGIESLFLSPTSSAQSGTDNTDWDAAVASYMAQQKQGATANMVAAQGVDPDKASVAKALAPVVGVPASVMENDPSYWQSQFKLQANQATVGTDANLQKWLAENPDNAKLSSDDIHQLGVVGRLSQGLSQGWRQGYLQQRVDELGFDEQTGTASPQQQDLLQTFKEQLGQQPSTKGAAAAVGRFLGGTAEMFANALPEAAAGAAAGVPLGGVGAIPGAIGGGATGFAVGIIGHAELEAEGAREAQYYSP